MQVQRWKDPAMITDIEDYFTKGCGRCPRFATADCSTRQWSQGLSDLRRICLSLGLTETVKWGHPYYMHTGRNIAILGAFRDNFRLTFMNAALLTNSDGLLQNQGPNSRTPNMSSASGFPNAAALPSQSFASSKLPELGLE